MFIVPTDTPGRRDHPQRRPRLRAARRRHPRLHPLHRRPRAGREPARRPRRRLRGGPDPPRRRSHPPRHAHRRHGAAGVRHDVRAGRCRGTRRASCSARKQLVQEHDRRLLDRARAVPAAGDAHRVAHRQVQGLQAGPQGHLGGEGGDAEGVPRRRGPGAAAPRLARRLRARCRSRPCVIESFHMGLADGPTEVHKVTVARQVLSEYQPTEGLFPTRHIPRLREEAIARYARRHRAAPRRAVSDAAGPADRPAAVEAPELAPVRPGEELDWPRSEAYVRAGVEGLDGPMEVAAVPERLGQPHLPPALRRRPSWCCGDRPSGWWLPAPTTCAASTGCCRGCGSSFDRAPRAFLFCDDHEVVGADFVVMERRHGEVVRDGVPAAMAHHADVDRRLSFALVDAMAELHLLDPAAAGVADLGQARGLHRPSGGRVAEPVGPGASRRRSADHGRAARPPGGGAAGTDAGVGRAQRPEARQLPVRRRRPRPRPVDLRLGHDHAGRAAGRPRDAAQLLARPE